VPGVECCGGINADWGGGPHPALRATFSRKREKERLGAAAAKPLSRKREKERHGRRRRKAPLPLAGEGLG